MRQEMRRRKLTVYFWFSSGHLLGQEMAFCVFVLVSLKEDGIHQKNIFSSKDSIKRSIQMTVEKKLLQRNFSSVEKICSKEKIYTEN